MSDQDQKQDKPVSRAIRQSVIKAVKSSKHIVGKSPRLKRIIRNVVFDSISLSQFQKEDKYEKWVNTHLPDAIDIVRQQAESKAFTYRPLVSILTPTYNTNIDYLSECIESVIAQSYDNWELLIVDDASPNGEVRECIKKFAEQDTRIKPIYRTKNGHISEATNDALQAAKGEFVGLLDHDDILLPHALFTAVKLLNEDKTIDFIYSDEDKIQNNRKSHQNPFFKPDWNPEFLESVNYITHFAFLRTKLVKKIGGFRSEYNGAQDWDLFLRMSRATQNIRHIPTVLYSWRMSETSTAASTDAKPYVTQAQKAALEDSLTARGAKSFEVVTGLSKDYWQVRYLPEGKPLISIVIPTKNQASIVKRCVKSILEKTTYQNYEIVLVDTGSTDSGVRKWYSTVIAQNKNVRVLDWPEQPFSYARSCNYGVTDAKGEFIVLLNNDTEVITPDWLEQLLSDAQREDVGAVGCKLFFPDKIHIQHAGIGIGLGGVAANTLSGVQENNMTPLQHLYANTRHEMTAVTAACLMIDKKKFDSINGFDEKFRVTYNDVDLCLRLKEAGYRTIYNPMAQLVHHESISVGLPEEKRKRDVSEFKTATQLFKKRWGKYIKSDPHLNPNIERTNALFEVGITTNGQ